MAGEGVAGGTGAGGVAGRGVAAGTAGGGKLDGRDAAPDVADAGAPAGGI
jgi:hypothetical protein